MIAPLHASDPEVIGPYRLLGRLGAGGMGLVYLGRSPGGRHVAVKVVQSPYLDEPVFQRRFGREVAAARRLAVRWIAPVLDADPEAEIPWLATEYVVGPSVQQAVMAHGPLPERTVRFLGARLAEALEEVHRAGLVHRDVKPANVLLAHDGPRLIDFGIARVLDQTALTTTGSVVGTPGYAAPEQVVGAGSDAPGEGNGPRSDVFSLGAVLAFALTGRRPFGAGSPEFALYRVVHEPPDLDGLPRALREVLGAALAKAPNDRPDAARLRAALEGSPPVPEADWLPGELVRLIAERASALIDRDGPGPDSPTGREPRTLPSADVTRADVTRVERRTDRAGSVDATLPIDGPDTTVPLTGPTVPADGDRAAPRAGSAAAPDGGARRLPEGRPALSRRGALLLGGGTLIGLSTGAGAVLWASRDGGSGGGPSAPREYTVGLHADLSGDAPEVGRAQERGARLAVERFNAREPAPFRLALAVADDRGQEADAERVAAGFVARREVVAVLGPTWNVTALAAARVYDQAALPTLVISPGTGELVEHLPRSLVRITSDDAAQAADLAGWLAGQGGIDRVGLADDGSAYGTSLTRAVRRKLGGALGTVLGTADGDAEAARAVARAASGTKALVFSGSPYAAAELARQLSREGYRGLRVGSDQVCDPAFPELAGDTAEGWLLVSRATDPAADPGLHGFASDYRKRFDAPAGWYAAEAYDAVNLVADALRRAGATPVSRAALVRSVRGARFAGVTKKLAFAAESGDLRGSGTFLYRVTQGRLRWRANLARAAEG